MKNFNEIYNELKPKVLGFLIKSTGNVELANDLTSDTMIKIFQNIDKFDQTRSKLSSWAISIAKNVAIDNHRKRKLLTTSISSFVDDEGNEYIQCPSYDTPYSNIVSKQLGEGIDLAFNKLPKIYKDIANLYFKKQLSYSEISDELIKPIGTVKATIHRIRKILQESLSDIN
jgi:RNA polymerase sigma-70 factor (ECF subfamily)